MNYLGKPWVSGACGPDAFDCWGLLWAVYRTEFGLEVPRFPGVRECGVREVTRLIAETSGGSEWDALTAPEHGCAVAMGKNARLSHVGLFLDLDGGLVLHAAEGRNVVAESLAKLRQFGINRQAFYRPRSWSTSFSLKTPLNPKNTGTLPMSAG